jgi:hypothetical protein
MHPTHDSAHDNCRANDHSTDMRHARIMYAPHALHHVHTCYAQNAFVQRCIMCDIAYMKTIPNTDTRNRAAQLIARIAQHNVTDPSTVTIATRVVTAHDTNTLCRTADQHYIRTHVFSVEYIARHTR